MHWSAGCSRCVGWTGYASDGTIWWRVSAGWRLWTTKRGKICVNSASRWRSSIKQPRRRRSGVFMNWQQKRDAVRSRLSRLAERDFYCCGRCWRKESIHRNFECREIGCAVASLIACAAVDFEGRPAIGTGVRHRTGASMTLSIPSCKQPSHSWGLATDDEAIVEEISARCSPGVIAANSTKRSRK